MEQSIKSVLVKQTIAHQQQQLTNLQVSCRPPSPPLPATSSFSSSSCACGRPRQGLWFSVSQGLLLGPPGLLPEPPVARPCLPVEHPEPRPAPPLCLCPPPPASSSSWTPDCRLRLPPRPPAAQGVVQPGGAFLPVPTAWAERGQAPPLQ